MDVSITQDCDGCGIKLDIPYSWNMGGINPKPSQVRVLILLYDKDAKELVEGTASPDLSRLILCDGCRETLVGDICLSLHKLQEKRVPAETESLRVM